MTQFTNSIPATEGKTFLSNSGKVEVQELDNSDSPLFLVLCRKGLVDTELRNPYTNDVVYRIRDTGRGSMSSKPDYEFYRPGAGDLFVGSIRFGKTSTEINMPLTNTKTKGTYDKLSPNHLTEGSGKYVWKTIKSERKVVKDRWYETNDDGRGEIHTNEEVIILNLVDAAKEDSDPISVVRLYNTQPNGRFEIWAKDAWVFSGGDWNALDELVVSCYANMEKAKRELMNGLDPSSWRGAAFAG